MATTSYLMKPRASTIVSGSHDTTSTVTSTGSWCAITLLGCFSGTESKHEIIHFNNDHNYTSLFSEADSM